jgi:hypothetical protein
MLWYLHVNLTMIQTKHVFFHRKAKLALKLSAGPGEGMREGILCRLIWLNPTLCTAPYSPLSLSFSVERADTLTLKIQH